MNVNYAYLLNIRYQKGRLVVVTSFIFLSISILILLLFSYDSYVTYGVYDGHYILVDIPIENSDAVNEEYYLKFNDQKYAYEVVEKSELLIQEYINYQTYKIKVASSNLELNEVVEVTFYYNKQRIIQKIINIIF